MLLYIKTSPGGAVMNYPPTSGFRLTQSHGIMKCAKITGALDTVQWCEVEVYLARC